MVFCCTSGQRQLVHAELWRLNLLVIAGPGRAGGWLVRPIWACSPYIPAHWSGTHIYVWVQALAECSCTAAPLHLHGEEQGGKGKLRIIQGWLCYSILCNEWV